MSLRKKTPSATDEHPIFTYSEGKENFSVCILRVVNPSMKPTEKNYQHPSHKDLLRLSILDGTTTIHLPTDAAAEGINYLHHPLILQQIKRDAAINLYFNAHGVGGDGGYVGTSSLIQDDEIRLTPDELAERITIMLRLAGLLTVNRRSAMPINIAILSCNSALYDNDRFLRLNEGDTSEEGHSPALDQIIRSQSPQLLAANYCLTKHTFIGKLHTALTTSFARALEGTDGERAAAANRFTVCGAAGFVYAAKSSKPSLEAITKLSRVCTHSVDVGIDRHELQLAEGLFTINSEGNAIFSPELPKLISRISMIKLAEPMAKAKQTAIDLLQPGQSNWWRNVSPEVKAAVFSQDKIDQIKSLAGLVASSDHEDMSKPSSATVTQRTKLQSLELIEEVEKLIAKSDTIGQCREK
jgi:hypothetical protein